MATISNLIEMFSGKVVLITGASSGIGAATAVYFAELGATLSLTGRNTKNLEDVSSKCEAAGAHKPLLITADLTNDEDIKRIIDVTIETFHKLDVLINNAGILELGSIEHADVHQYDRVFQTNVRSVYLLTTLAVPHLIETKGNIINVSSINGLRAFTGVLTYCMSKAALDQFTRCTALELAPKQVRVNSVNPGVVISEIQRRSGMDEEQYRQFLERAKITHPLGRVGQPDEVAKAIAFLASDSASFSTGVTLSVDGGRHAMCPR